MLAHKLIIPAKQLNVVVIKDLTYKKVQKGRFNILEMVLVLKVFHIQTDRVFYFSIDFYKETPEQVFSCKL